MKKGLLFILLAAVSVCLPAQEKENAAKSYRVDTNRFGANWFISGGVGAQMYLATMMVKPTSENVLLRHLTLL